jgi:hypothetical protein
MTELFMLLSELGFSDRALTKSFWLIGTIAAGVVLIVRRQQILPTIKRLNEKCREPRVRDCLIFAPCCALCGAAVYFLVMPFCFSQADTAKIMEEPPPTAKDWILGYFVFLTFCSNRLCQ